MSAVILVVMTLASIIAALTLIRLSQRRMTEWFSPTVQLSALAVVGVVQLTIIGIMVVQPLVVAGSYFGVANVVTGSLSAVQVLGVVLGMRATTGRPR